MKIFINKTNERWICDRLTDEWYHHHGKNNVSDPRESDIVWLMASWSWRNIPLEILKNKKVVATIHHLVPEKINLDDFRARDQITDLYHVPCNKTRNQVKNLTKKPIKVIPFWANSKMWFEMKDKSKLRKKYGYPADAVIIGSFQRDTEGSDCISPKLEKGPDIFCDIVEKLHRKNSNVQVCLAAWRRQYIIGRLEKNKIKYNYFRLCDAVIMNELYNMLDLYIISSRYEGGPQSIIECGLCKTPLVSTNVGLAEHFLDKQSMYTDLSDFHQAVPNPDFVYNKVNNICIPEGMTMFDKMFQSLTD